MKTAILNKLTSSKNERKAFAAVWDICEKSGKPSKIIRQKDWAAHGLPYRSGRNEAVIRLMKKGIIARDEIDGQSFHIDARIFRYAVKKWGCTRFLTFVESRCFDCYKAVKK